MTTFVVINPRAGRGSIGRSWSELSGLLAAKIGDYDEAFATGPGEIVGLVAGAVAAGATRIIAVGGDGTINEVVNGLGARTETIPDGVELGMISTGTGSDFARGLGIPANPVVAIDHIAADRTRRIDIGRVSFVGNDGAPKVRLFANIASFGISGLIDDKVNAASAGRLLPGLVSYYLATVTALVRYRFQRVRLTVDDQPPVESEIALVAVANCRYFGGGMMVAPDAEPDDGIFDVVTLRGTSKLVLLRDLRLVYRGAHRDHPAITITRGRKIHAEPIGDKSGPVLMDIDGDAPGRLPATFEVLPGALRVLC